MFNNTAIVSFVFRVCVCVCVLGCFLLLLLLLLGGGCFIRSFDNFNGILVADKMDQTGKYGHLVSFGNKNKSSGELGDTPTSPQKPTSRGYSSSISMHAPSPSITDPAEFIDMAATNESEIITPLSKRQLLLRGARLRATDWAVCVVVYTGKMTKLALNQQVIVSMIFMGYHALVQTITKILVIWAYPYITNTLTHACK